MTLFKFKTYLAGSMENAKDGGTGWRETLTKRLAEEVPNLVVRDPAKSEPDKTGYNVGESKNIAYKWKKEGNLEKVKEMFKKIITVDMRLVRTSDFVILYWKDDDKFGGTISEITEAYKNGVPIFCMFDGHFKNVNSWVLSMVLLTGEIFTTWDDLINRVKEEVK